MNRWNGWGDERIAYHLPEDAAEYLSELLGEGNPTKDAGFEDVLHQVPETRLAENPLISTEPDERLRHARGQSLPDWIDLRSGSIAEFPDGVAYPTTCESVRELLAYAKRAQCRLIPYGGGTSVVGHINPMPGERPILTVDLSRLNDFHDWDETSCLATFGAGIRGPAIEAHLNPLGYTLGHYPQSFEYSTLGGWIATRSSGQQSYYYGRIEDLFAGGWLESPAGSLYLPPMPASAAGPDLRQLVLGSEGRFGIITRGLVRVRPLPEEEKFKAVFFHDWPSGIEAVRQLAQNRVLVSMLRLSDPQETQTTLALAGNSHAVALLDKGLRLLRYGDERCLLIYCLTGNSDHIRLAGRALGEICRQNGALLAGELIGNTWRKNRFRSPYLRNTLWDRGYAVDTLETAVPWSKVEYTVAFIREGLLQALQHLNERVLVLVHLSHVYLDGASIYVTYLYRRVPDPDAMKERWRLLKDAASQAILAQEGTISHQHGVGVDHARYVPFEKGHLGMSLLRDLGQALDAEGLMNPGKLFNQHCNQPVDTDMKRVE